LVKGATQIFSLEFILLFVALDLQDPFANEKTIMIAIKGKNSFLIGIINPTLYYH